MDFVVAGFGLGAVIVLVGFALRDVGPYLRRRSQPEIAAAWTRLCWTTGSSLVACGFAVCLVTIVFLALGVDDDLANQLVWAGIILALAFCAVRAVIAARAFALIQRLAQPEFSYEAPQSRAPQSPAIPRWQPAANPPQTTIPAPSPQPAPAPPKVPDPVPEKNTAPITLPQPEPPPTEPASSRQPTGPFASPILADVGEDVGGGDVTGFRSSVLADLSTDRAPDNGQTAFSSAILADLTFGPTLPTSDDPPSTESSAKNDQPSDDEESPVAGPVIPGPRQDS